MTNKARITVLVENTAQGVGMLAEHGLAYWIDWDGRGVLFDTGQGRVLQDNARKLGVALDGARAIVLSHGHYDHTGGLADVLDGGCTAPIYVHPAALDSKYARNRDGTSREIGMTATAREVLRRNTTRVVSTESPTEVLDGVTVTGPVPRTTDFEDTGGPFFLDAACLLPDPLLDDQSLFLDTAEGIVVLLGCAHSGVVNTLRYVARLSSGRPIRAVIGGMHLVGASDERIARTVEALRQLDVALLAPAHCTGMAATTTLWTAFAGQCAACHVGATFEFEVG